MSSVPLTVGLDYSEEFVRVCVENARDGTMVVNRNCANDWQAIQRLAERHGRVERAAIESCSGAASLAEELTGKAGWTMHLAHPGFVARMKQNPDKTDYQDAHVLADLERVGYLPQVWLAPPAVRELRLLVRYRQVLAAQKRATKLRIGALLREQRCRAPQGVNRWTKAWQRWLSGEAALSEQGRYLAKKHLEEIVRLQEEIGEVEARLAGVTEGDTLVQGLRKQKGIGPVTAWTLRAEVGRFDRFQSGKQLSRFCGLSPRNASSGQRQADAGLIKAANPGLRAVLIEAAHRLIWYEPKWRALAQRLRQAGKPGSVVAAAVANRWIRWLYYEMTAKAA